MNTASNQKNDLSILLKKYNIDKNKLIIPITELNFYNIENVVNNDKLFDLQCPICLNILKEAKSCSTNKKSHSFCKECIDLYLKENNNCPICKHIFEYKSNDEINKLLNKIKFKCLFYKEGCDKIINYIEYFNHISKCTYKKNRYECKVEKYNFKIKIFEKCNYRGDIQETENHFKICGFLKYKCKFCEEYILQMKLKEQLKEHIENKCKIGIINYENGDRYIGEKKNRTKEGYGIYYYSNGKIYKGEWKNDIKEGFGILYLSNRDIYEGEWKNNKKEGYGIYYYSSGSKYLGEWKFNTKNGNGIYYYSNGDKYVGELKNNIKNGNGIYYYSDGKKYEGEWKDDKYNGYGFYYLNGNTYKGKFFNNSFNGYGILYLSNKNKYEGE